ncbi:MAG: prepilin-type N-terminal cleavage/methylation domain-containing protein [Planctomycetales bacterium]|nr:prepilin-type N-terminal cleavage/methylation domain-containing protein [Planctomycetales bacterium]
MRSQPRNLVRHRITGFTLVEMLVAVTIVLLIMSMFAQLFQLAGGSVSKQRGIMENDQRARSVQTIIKADLDKRTFRSVIPFFRGEQVDVQASEADLIHRRGYLYYSENDPLNDGDDMLQFTVDSELTAFNSDTTPFVGYSLPISPAGSSALQTAQFMYNNQNQPEVDDGTFDINYTSRSPAAEVSYFLRNGNLYRRIVLIRKEPSGETNPQPKDNINQSDFFETDSTKRGPAWYPTGVTGATVFYRDFDFSAVPDATSATRLRFNGMTLLNNGEDARYLSMGIPHHRFGHHHETGRSTEYLSYNGGAIRYAGRFTLEEQSHLSFNYPRALAAGTVTQMNPNFGNANNLPDINNNTVWDTYENGTRRGEDLLLPNVHSFDVKLWDENTNSGLGGFVDIEGTGAVDFAAIQTFNDIYGSQTTGNRTFDTWHSRVPWDDDNDGTVAAGEYGRPPFRPLKAYPTGVYGASFTPTQPRWQGGQSWASAPVGLKWFPSNYVFPAPNSNPIRPPGEPFYYICVGAEGAGPFRNSWGEDLDFDSNLDVDEDLNDNNMRDVGEPDVDGDGFLDTVNEDFLASAPDPARGNGSLDYDIYEPGRNGRASWPRKPGLRVRDGNLIWQAVDNRKPLRALQITLRFQDPTTAQIRTQTIVHSLID